MRLLVALAAAAALLLAGCASAPPPSTPEDRSADERPGEEESTDGGTEGPSSQAPTSAPPTGRPSSSPSGKPSGRPSGTSPPPPPPTQPEGPAGPPPRQWASPGSAKIRPGASLDDGSCTANFVFTSLDNSTVYLGTAAHCFTTSDNTVTNGCEAGIKPLGTTMEVQGAAYPAALAYSSWVAMHEIQETNGDACSYNDFALLKLDPRDYPNVSPAMMKFGGPTGVADPTGVSMLDKVLTYGNSGLRPRDSPASPKEGYVAFEPGGGWRADIYTATPGVPGDSGSGVLTGDGEALGDMVTVSAMGSNGVTVLAQALAWAKGHGFEVQLATWELIDGGLLPPL